MIIENFVEKKKYKNNMTWNQVLFYSMMPFGQLFYRIFYLGGSLNKSWLLFPLFLIPPFSLIPMMLIKKGFVKREKRKNPLNNLILMPILAKLILPFILSMFISLDNQLSHKLIIFSIVLPLVILLNIKTREKICKNMVVATPSNITNSVISYGIAELLVFIMPFIPMYGNIINIAHGTPLLKTLVNPLIWSFGFFVTHIIMSLINQKNRNKYCNNDKIKNKKVMARIFLVLVFFVIIEGLRTGKINMKINNFKNLSKLK